MSGHVREVTVVPHSPLFYWWPVWAVGLVLALVSHADYHEFAVLPDTAEVRSNQPGIFMDSTNSPRSFGSQDVIFLPPNTLTIKRTSYGTPATLWVPGERGRTYGIVFLATLVGVLVVTNTSPRGGTFFLAAVSAALTAAVAFVCDFRASTGLFLSVSLALFVLWLLALLVFDRGAYITFTAGQMRVCLHPGDGERVYDMTGLTLEKRRDDPLRYLLLGLGSGDLVVRTSGAAPDTIELPNVLFLGTKMSQIEGVLRRRVW